MIIFRKDTLLTAILQILIIFISFMVTCPFAYAAFTIEDEKKVGKEFYDKLEENDVIVKDVKVNKYINNIGQLIVSKANNVPFDFTFSVINSSAINAFATPGGYVYLHRGLINLTENESQLAGVLAHEIAHVNSRHIADMIKKSQKVNIAALAAMLAGAFLGGGGEGTAAVMGFSLATATHLNLKYSRQHEEEADRLGASYLMKAGYDVGATLDFLRIMRRYEFYSNSVPSYFLTHPETDARIRYLDGLLQTTYKLKGRESIFHSYRKIKISMMLDGDNLNAALKHFQDETEINPRDSDALYGLALTQFKLGFINESLTTFQKAYEVAPNDEDILRELGKCYIKAGQTSQAIAHLIKAIQINPEDADSLFNLGKAYAAAGNYAAALDKYKQAEIQDKGNDEIYYNLAVAYGKTNETGLSHYYFGIYFKKKDRRQSAIFHFQEALKFLSQDAQKSQDIQEELKSLRKKTR
ncbi:MAG: M48 family metalloprotease [Deltaproteobacteria bacterium]|nr:M48 family metalloprotease [Deltaproteobacteria bacterium]